MPPAAGYYEHTIRSDVRQGHCTSFHKAAEVGGQSLSYVRDSVVPSYFISLEINESPLAQK